MNRILAVEDDADFQNFLVHTLSADFELLIKSSHAEVLQAVQSFKPQLILLDIDLPEKSGFEIAELIREQTVLRKVPILFVTGHSDIASLERGLDLGADDYLIKPLSASELRARCSARLSRFQLSKDSEAVLRCGALSLNLITREAIFSEKDKSTTAELSPQESQILALLMQNEGEVMGRAELLQKLNLIQDGKSNFRLIDNPMSSLKKKLPPLVDLVETIYGVGYRLKYATLALSDLPQ